MQKYRGFTLIELMIVVLIIGVVSAIAFPQYTKFVRESRKTDAQADMQELASFMERQFTVNNGYYSSGTTKLKDADLPFVSSSRGGGSDYYKYKLTGVGATAYTITATTVGDQASYKGCGTGDPDMTLDETGAVTPTVCWK